ncbi:uncharacterized protein LOC125556683 isoform X2 [Nematostella vectensis]|uniref:uncharacterized protein LOC125556683 isoform X2 n=1 Tax=Nematostella vectensis TaxID=45351 RepID=UPI002077073F|nr:uncharacterized protein LOC125556683 isoform X2 [Nematostella vectensis]
MSYYYYYHCKSAIKSKVMVNYQMSHYFQSLDLAYSIYNFFNQLPLFVLVNSGQIPSRIQIKLPWSKADKHAKGVNLSLWANPLNPKLCPVMALISWLLFSGITKGYIFPRIAKDNRRALPSKRSVASYRTIFSKMTKALFEKPYTTHSIRRSAARWAARCGADDSTIKRAGRWKSSSFELYTQDARAEMVMVNGTMHGRKTM